MQFLNRFYFYSIGILLGVGLLFLSLKFRDAPLSFNYLPNSRVVNYLVTKPISISDFVECRMDCFNLDTLLIHDYILNSKVNFKKSEIHDSKCKKYFLTLDSIDFIIKNCNNKSEILNVYSSSLSCSQCN